IYTFVDPDLGREWARHLLIADISRSDVAIDWEHTEYKWLSPEETTEYATTPGFQADLKKVIGL
ncbi:hypothetical protein KW799_02030, partial [Candidatus Parcubacteria bacterium]|nr:hypothetical protein [Candidatus Parcubacteria bacterium]